jgi:proteasome assembly chaperone (PAC2) family protein
MSSSEAEKKATNVRLNFSCQPSFERSSMIIGWEMDTSKLGTAVVDYLVQSLGCQSFCEIDPVDFFSLSGVSILDNVVHFPVSKFYACTEKNLVLFKSTPPSSDWLSFLELVLDVGEKFCHTREIYTIGGIGSVLAHTAPVRILSTCNSSEMKQELAGYQISSSKDYETPDGQRPTLNSFLLWAAKRRSIPGVTLWAPIPFYLMDVDEPRSRKAVLSLLNQRLALGLDLGDLDEEIASHNRILAEAREAYPEVNASIMKIEGNLDLSDEENVRLVKDIDNILSRKE